MEIADTYEFLLGEWSIERTINDHKSGQLGRFCGVATLSRLALVAGTPAGGGRYEESGILRFGAYEGRAGRRLEYLRQGDGSVLIIRGDGRPFIACNLTTGSWRARHLCGDDRYELSFDVRSRDTIEEHWRVRGPAKDYDAQAILRRRARARTSHARVRKS